MLKTIYKKIIQFILCLSIFSFFPIIVFGKTMEVLEPSYKDVYKIKFSWEKPNKNLPKNEVLDSYRIYYRNNTLGEEYNLKNVIYHKEDIKKENQSITKEISLKQGSLYNFKIVPVYVKEEDKESIEIEGQIITEFLFMTDILVKTIDEDKENTINVYFKVPTASGKKHFFSDYEISVAEILYGQKLQWSEGKRIKADKLIIDDKGYTSYEITNNDFVPGNLYAIKLEPIYKDKFRDDIIHKEVDCDNKLYIFSTTSIGKKIFTYDKTYVKIPLHLTLLSLVDINLHWPSLVKSSIGERISKLEIFKFEMVNNSEVKSSLGSFYDQSARVTTDFNLQVPKVKPVEFMITLTYKDIIYLNEDGSTVGPFNILVNSKRAIYNPDLNDFSPYRPNIYDITDNREKPFNLNLTWEAFLRDPYDKGEEIDEEYGKYLDKDITYKIWVTDNRNNFERLKDETALILDGKNLNVKNINGKPYFTTNLEKYYYFDEKNNISSGAFFENKIYYVKIIAVRNKNKQESKMDCRAHYIIPINSIPMTPNVMAKPILRIKKINGVEEITKSSITIEWDEEWFEIYDENSKAWHSKLGVENNKLIFGDNVKEDKNILYNLRVLKDNGDLNYEFTKKKIIEELSKYIDMPVLRIISLKGAKYKLHVVDFSELEKIGYSKYTDRLNIEDPIYKWVDIIPKRTKNLEHKCETVQNIEGPMKDSSPYVIFIKPFEGEKDKFRIACYPTYISATTIRDINQGNIKPIIPILYEVGSTDTTITIKWEYIEELKYEVRFAETMNKYPNEGIIIDNDFIKKNGIIKQEKNKNYIYLTIDKLFPESIYFVWAKSLIKTNQGESTSNYSNAVEIHTKNLEAPYAPLGLGLASPGNIKAYNVPNNKKYVPIGKDYIIVEWIKNSDDKVVITEGSGLDTDLAQPLYGADLNKGTYMLKFNKLISNKRYYIRAKTNLAVSKDKDGILLKKYTYTVQLSLDEDFKETIEIEMPKDKNDNNNDDKNKRIIYKDSEWSVISLFSGYSQDEYDGDKNQDLYPIPSKDYEIIYINDTCTLKYRFRANSTDSLKNKDNNVDERLISKLITNKNFMYEIDISNYKFKKIKNRIVEVPLSIIYAFNERKIDIKIIADNFILIIPSNSINIDKIKSINAYSKDIKLLIEISENFNLKNNYIYLSKPQKLSMKISSGNNIININDFSKPLKISMILPKNVDIFKNNISAYMKENSGEKWEIILSEYDEDNDFITFSTEKTAIYSVIKLDNININNNQETKENILSVRSKLNIKDLENYNENEIIYANQYNQIISAILKKDKEVLMNKPLNNTDYNNLGKAKVLLSGKEVSKESGISSLVKVYEIISKEQIKSYEDINNTVYKDIKNADSKYKINLLKAAKLGFFREPNAKPKDNLNMGDLIYILDIILNI